MVSTMVALVRNASRNHQYHPIDQTVPFGWELIGLFLGSDDLQTPANATEGFVEAPELSTRKPLTSH